MALRSRLCLSFLLTDFRGLTQKTQTDLIKLYTNNLHGPVEIPCGRAVQCIGTLLESDSCGRFTGS